MEWRRRPDFPEYDDIETVGQIDDQAAIVELWAQKLGFL